jgi:predicted DNA-binding transcriptional regulator
MGTNTKKHRLGIVDFALVDAGLSHHEALVYSYVQRFERNKRPCFASIPHIASELRFSESATKRHIRRLIQLGYLRETTKGRGRYLNTIGVKLNRMNEVNLNPTEVKLNPYRGQNDPNDRGQNEPLPLKVLPLEITNKNIPRAAPVTKQGEYDWLKESTGISLDDIPE